VGAVSVRPDRRDIAARNKVRERAARRTVPLLAAGHRAQADALEIMAGAKHRLADEYDAAQDRGEAIHPARRAREVPTGAVVTATGGDRRDGRRPGVALIRGKSAPVQPTDFAPNFYFSRPFM
jgi:hypothetical protein